MDTNNSKATVEAATDRTLERWRKVPLTMALSDVCQWTGYGRNRIRQLAREGKIKQCGDGMRRRYRKVDIADLIGLPL